MKNLFTSVLLSALVPLSALGSGIRKCGFITGIAGIFFLTDVASAQNAIVAIDVKTNHEMDTKSVWDKPFVIKSDEDAAKHFGVEELKTLKAAVDWDKQIVLVFVWKGSGQDKLEHQILESYPEQIPFTMKLGMTRDLRLHSQVFALRSNIKWSVK